MEKCFLNMYSMTKLVTYQCKGTLNCDCSIEVAEPKTWEIIALRLSQEEPTYGYT